MKQQFRPLAALGLAAAILMPAYAQKAVPVKDFDVFVDLPSGFAFIKTPDAWRFIRQLDAEQLTRLHPSTLTALLEPEDKSTAEAGNTESKPAGVDFSTLAYLP